MQSLSTISTTSDPSRELVLTEAGPGHALPIRAGVPTASTEDVQETGRSLDGWRAANPYYHARIKQYLQFMIPKGQSVLLIGCEDGALLTALRPKRGVGVENGERLLNCARIRNAQHKYITAPDWMPNIDERFDYVVINDTLDHADDVFCILQAIRTVCDPATRLIVIHPSPWCRPVSRPVGRPSGSASSALRNRLSASDLNVLLYGAGFETIGVQPKLYGSRRLLGLGWLANRLGGLLPFARRLATVQMIVARSTPSYIQDASKSATIVMAMRDEQENVEPLIRAIPEVGSHTQILIVEGHSRDGTREEIERVIEAYPEKDIRLLVQTGDGVGNAIHEGFTAAQGDVVILLEADRTSPPEDVRKVYDMIASGRADYVNGTRLMYPRERGAMPWVNMLGNRLFAAWTGWILRQPASDVLCGLKGIDGVQLQRLLENWGFLGVVDPFSDFELVFGAARLNLKICEVPTRYTRRQYGWTKARAFRDGWKLARVAARATGVFRFQ